MEEVTRAEPSKIKIFGFKYATYSGVTWGIDDVKIPEKKAAHLK